MLDLFDIPDPKISEPKIPKVKNFKVYLCKRCGAGAPRFRKLCDKCNAIRLEPKPKAERPTHVPCVKCGTPLPAKLKLRPRTCSDCLRAAKREKLQSDPEYKAKIYARNNEKALQARRAAGAKPLGETNKERARLRAEAEPFKTCRICGNTKERAKFKVGRVCTTCVNRRKRKLKTEREKLPTHPKQIEAERRTILKRFDLFAPEKLEHRRELKRAARSNPISRVDKNISELIRIALKKNKTGWRSSVGWSMLELKTHIESQFRLGMSWDNYGKWHIDHIKPRSLFSYSSPDDQEFKDCWALSNLQPLWGWENSSKRDAYPCPYYGNLII